MLSDIFHVCYNYNYDKTLKHIHLIIQIFLGALLLVFITYVKRLCLMLTYREGILLLFVRVIQKENGVQLMTFIHLHWLLIYDYIRMEAKMSIKI